MTRLGLGRLQGGGVGLQKAFQHHQIAVDKDNRVALGFFNPQVAGGGGAFVVLLKQHHMGQFPLVLPQPSHGAIGGAIVYHHHLVACDQGGIVGLLIQRPQTFL